MKTKVFYYRHPDNSVDFVCADEKEEAERIVGKPTDGHISVLTLFSPEVRSALQLAGAMDLAVMEHGDWLDFEEKRTVKRAAEKIRMSYFA